MSLLKYLVWPLMILIGLVPIQTAYSANEDHPMQKNPVSFEAIADLNSVKDAEAWAKRNGIPYENQSNQVMEAQRQPQLNEAKRFGAIGRFSMTVNLRNNSISVHIDLFYSKTGGILGRMIQIENLYE